MQTFAITAATLALAAGVASGQVKGAIESVTVYRGQALVTRAIELPLNNPGLAEIVVTDLPPSIQPESLHAESSGSLRVQSVRYRTRPVEADVNHEVKALDEKIEETRRLIAALTRRQALLEEHRKYLDNLQAFVAPTAGIELTRGVLNAETLEKISLFQMSQREKLAESELALGIDRKAAESRLQHLTAQRQAVAAGSSRLVREAVVTISRDAGEGRLRLRYLVNHASWSPSYNIRSEDGRDGVRLEYHAAVQQQSGEDWTDAAMTLSTATPTLTARGPDLIPLIITLGHGGDPGAAQSMLMSKGYEDARKELLGRQRAIAEVRNVAPQRRDDGPAPDLDLNDLACNVQVLDIIAGERVNRDSRPRFDRHDEVVSVSYEIPGATTLPSRPERQFVRITSAQLPAAFAKVATPVLTPHVYNQASVTNTSGVVLLAGPVTAYLNGAFVGGGETSTVADGQSFIVGFGIDSSLRAGRELVERVESTQGGNRVVELVYRLSVENFGSAPAPIRLLDRLPSSPSREITITLGSMTHNLSEDKEYARLRKEGILRWDADIPPAASGLNEWSLEYRFRIEHDRQMTLLGMSPTPR